MRKQLLYIFTAILMFSSMAAFAQDHFYESLFKKGFDVVIVENEGVKNFLDDRSYDKPDLTSKYSHSIVKKYSKGYPSKPAGITLQWDSITPTEDISSIVVTLLESDKELKGSAIDRGFYKEKNLKRYYPDKSSHEYLLCNMCPHKYYYYKVEEVLYNGHKNTLLKGKFYADGQIRMLRVDGMANVRDFGGWDTSFDRAVVYGRIFRGNRPEGITSTGKNDFVKNEHITADLDLRGKDLGRSPLGPLDKVEYFCTNNQRYKYGLISSKTALAKDLNFIASVLRKGGSVFLHCNHGANRAGTLSFVISGILGLSEADLSRDYELSAFAYSSISRSKTYGDMLPEIRSYGEDDDDLAQCFYNYARSIGVSEKNLDTIRSIMLDLPPDDPRILDAHR